jgi:flavin reductase (DIM6/NTAB) family NADH-FMN oxidoreductase RutF
MGIRGDDLRELMRFWATGVTLVTVRDDHGPHGMTVSSFTSLSLDPPLILISLERSSRTHAMVASVGRFAVVLLALEQQQLAERFAGGVDDSGSRFDGVAFDLSEGGAPVPHGSLAYLDCRVHEVHPAGTHSIFVGEVTGGRSGIASDPLLYFNRAYRRLEG